MILSELKDPSGLDEFMLYCPGSRHSLQVLAGTPWWIRFEPVKVIRPYQEASFLS